MISFQWSQTIKIQIGNLQFKFNQHSICVYNHLFLKMHKKISFSYKTHNVKLTLLYIAPNSHTFIQYQMTSIQPIVQNVVSFAKLQIEKELDLKFLAEKIQNCRYNKKRFPAVVIRKIKPKSTVLVFKSGKIIIIGAQSQKDSHTTAKKVGKDIKKILNLKQCKVAEFRVTNIVANADLGYKIDLVKLADQHDAVKDDSFPGVVYRNIKSIKAALLFCSGKVVFTGAKQRNSISLAFQQLKLKLLKFKKVDKYQQTQAQNDD